MAQLVFLLSQYKRERARQHRCVVGRNHFIVRVSQLAGGSSLEASPEDDSWEILVYRCESVHPAAITFWLLKRAHSIACL